MNDFRSRVEGERPYLLRYASLQLRDRQAAEDAVQDTLVAALAGESGFAGRSNLRTWLTGILKHKIVDIVRKAAREAPLPEGEGDTADFDALFDASGHWASPPADWSNAASASSRSSTAPTAAPAPGTPTPTSRTATPPSAARSIAPSPAS